MLETVLMWVGVCAAIFGAISILLSLVKNFMRLFIGPYGIINMRLEWALRSIERAIPKNDEEKLKRTLEYLEDMVRTKWDQIDENANSQKIGFRLDTHEKKTDNKNGF